MTGRFSLRALAPRRLFATRLLSPMLRLIAAGVVAAVLYVVITNAIENPTTVSTSAYRAEFADASGLRPNADVRIRGVRVGKVDSVDLSQDGVRSVAVVRFTVDESRTLTDATQLSIKYANLSGIRYLDVAGVDVAGAGGSRTAVTDFGLDQTTSSFDITDLFNGLQPTLELLQPAEINQFTQNALALIQGDGRGLAPMLKNIDTLASYAADRQQVISVLVRNLARLSAVLGGKSPQILEILHLLESPIDKAMSVLEEFGKGAKFGPPLMGTLNQILAGLGIDETADTRAEQLFGRAFPVLDDLRAALSLIPTIADGIGRTRTDRPVASAQCSHGEIEVPATVRVLLAGNAVTICKS